MVFKKGALFCALRHLTRRLLCEALHKAPTRVQDLWHFKPFIRTAVNKACSSLETLDRLNEGWGIRAHIRVAKGARIGEQRLQNGLTDAHAAKCSSHIDAFDFTHAIAQWPQPAHAMYSVVIPRIASRWVAGMPGVAGMKMGSLDMDRC